MQLVKYLCVATLAAGWSGTALAQTSPSGPPPATAQPTLVGPIETHWLTSGFVGSNIGATGDNPAVRNQASLDYGGQFAYMWNGFIGAEFIAEYAPSFNVTNPLLPDNAKVATYMGNAIVGIPFGAGGSFQPYASGGAGGLSLRASVITDLSGTTTNSTQTTWAWDAGGGVMGFAGTNGRWGFRADGRYYRAGSKTLNGATIQDVVTQSLMSNLAFWRASVGVAYRF